MGCKEKFRQAVGEIIAGGLVILVIIGLIAVIFLCYQVIWLLENGQILTMP